MPEPRVERPFPPWARVVGLVCAFHLMHCHWGLAGVLKYGSAASPPYRAEALTQALGAASVRTLGCLDVGLAVSAGTGVDILDLHIGNRCSHPEEIDLRGLAIRGTDPEGQSERIVALRDPRNEVVSYHLGGGEAGEERFRLDHSAGTGRLCFDLTRVAPDSPQAKPAPVCFERRAATWVAIGDPA